MIPVLHYPDVAGAAAWLCRAFGFTERLRIGNHRVQLAVAGAGAIVVTQGSMRLDLCDAELTGAVDDASSRFMQACRPEQ